MNLRIHNYLELCNLLEAEPRQHDCIMICGSDDRNDQQRVRKDIVQQHARNHLFLTFDDMTWKDEQHIAPARSHVEEALCWSQGREGIIVACAAGISRSSATAYILACSRMPPEEAIKVLDMHRHWPNEWVVQHGTEVLNNDDVWSVFGVWREKVLDLRTRRPD